jgi:hypothetical protein
MTREEVIAIIEQYFQAEDVELAAWVVRCESVYDAAAIHPSGTVGGLFQHLLSAWDGRAAGAGFPGEPWWNPEANTAAAARLWYGSLGPAHHWPNCYQWALTQLP